MDEYTISWSLLFQKLYDRLDPSEQQWIRKIENKLKLNPSGNILRYSWFREKKYLDKRLYYLVHEHNKKILFIAFGSKKEQERTIQDVVDHMEEWLETLNEL